MEAIIKQAVHESRNSEKVVKFLTENELSISMIKAIEKGTINGLFYENGEIVAEDIWGNSFTTNILK